MKTLEVVAFAFLILVVLAFELVRPKPDQFSHRD